MAVNPEPGSGGFAAPAQKGVGSKNAQKQATKQSNPGSPCLVALPSLPIVGTVGSGCLFTKTSARAFIGGFLIFAGGTTVLLGGIVLAAAGFRKSGALNRAASVAGAVPGGGGVAAGIRAAGQPRSQRPAARRERAGMRRLGEPRMNPNLREGRGAIRETPAGTRRRRAERDRPPF